MAMQQQPSTSSTSAIAVVPDEEEEASDKALGVAKLEVKKFYFEFVRKLFTFYLFLQFFS